ncbi:AsnC family transcriptional regulator [Heliobacterium undosum]|uniref:AsnC family transcriptional regulator n=1 Tax=Heliomicrobium undosum TaxID=121734 RepID=A0A845L0V0_9FIRM|nr:Lrp/AsnC family transcriptional regulator [Heliomicrobium undosum]MZP28559.1 AsnC family transcriptional regulator [Heliomicrobium undosum]
MLDQTDREILRLLEQNSRLQWKEIGELVHMTGQAVASRIRRLEEIGVIEGFTIKVNQEKIGLPIVAMITVSMKTNHHKAFQDFITQEAAIVESHRISGDGCYWLKACLENTESLDRLLDDILRYGNYRLHLSISKVK